MCRRVTCKSCGKPSWAGCGAHVDMVMGDVPPADRCRCREAGARAATKPGAAKASTADAPKGTLGRLKTWLQQ